MKLHRKFCLAVQFLFVLQSIIIALLMFILYNIFVLLDSVFEQGTTAVNIQGGNSMAGEKLRKIKAFSEYPNRLSDKQQINKAGALMYPAYQSALCALKNVLISSESWVEENRHAKEKDFYAYGNNVIAFCGPRGQGKTSAMLSFSNALKEYNAPCHTAPLQDKMYRHGFSAQQRSCKAREKEVGDFIYRVMPPIDPTILDEKESVVGLILARLFTEINNKWKNSEEPEELIEQNQVAVLQHFQKCTSCLALHSGVKERDLSDLIKSSTILEFKQHLYDIIKCYFRLSGYPEEEQILVIQLDDTDMDMKNAYDVLEDVRKFLSLPQVVVLMATYLRQLRTLVAKHYEETLSVSQIRQGSLPVRADYMQMAAKYIDKLIPSQQMIHINSFRYQRDMNGVIKICDFDDGTDDSLAELDDDLEDEFYDLIEEKTGLIFLRHSTYVNNILPTTLRGLVHLFQLLDRMETPCPPKESIYKSVVKRGAPSEMEEYYNDFVLSLQVKQRNLILFEDYFRNDWCYHNLEETDQEIMWAISQTHVAPKLRITRNLLAKKWGWVNDYLNQKPAPDSENAALKKCSFSISRDNTDENKYSFHYQWEQASETQSETSTRFSFFEMVNLLDEAEGRAESMNDLLLVFAVRTHLSILMHKLYLSDMLASLSDPETRVGFEKSNQTQFDMGVYRKNGLKQLKLFLKVSRFQENSGAYIMSLKDIRQALKQLFTSPKEGLDKMGQEDRQELLYLLLFEGVDIESVISNLQEQDSSLPNVLQEAVFRVLGNHDILRLYLSNLPERFKKCSIYVYDENAVSETSPMQTRPKNSKAIFSIINELVTIQSP